MFRPLHPIFLPNEPVLELLPQRRDVAPPGARFGHSADRFAAFAATDRAVGRLAVAWRCGTARRCGHQQPSRAQARSGHDRPRLRGEAVRRRPRSRGRVLAWPVHQGIRRRVRRDARQVPNPPASRAGVRTAPLGQPDRHRDLHGRRVQQPRHLQPPVRRHRGPVAVRVPGGSREARRSRSDPRLLRADVANRPARGGPCGGGEARCWRPCTRARVTRSGPQFRRSAAVGPGRTVDQASTWRSHRGRTR